MSRIHLFVHSLVPHDAISNHSRHVRDMLTEQGIMGNTYVWESRGTKRGEVKSYRDFSSTKFAEGDIALYQLSTGSPIAKMLAAGNIPLVVNYHNITTPSLYEEWEPHIGGELEKGLRQLRELAPRTELGIGVSKFNEAQMQDYGYKQTTVVPILFDTSTFARESDSNVDRELQTRRKDGEDIWLFVGRISPNKCQHDIVKAFAYYRQTVNPKAHLYLVGGESSHAYGEALRDFVATAGLADTVTFAGTVSDAALASYYRGSSVFVCLSEHEGFCVPVLEAFHNRLPIVAFRSTAIPETVQEAGLLVDDKSPVVVAEVVHKLLNDVALRDQLVQAGLHRLDDFNIETTKSTFMAALQKVESFEKVLA